MRLPSRIFLILACLLLAGSAQGAPGKLLGVKTSVDAQGTTLMLRLPPPVEFTPSQVGPRLYLLDLAGVSTDQAPDTQAVQSPLLSSYRIFSYQGADGRPHVGVELTLKEQAEVSSATVADGLQIRVKSLSAAVKPPAPTPAAAAPAPAVKPAPAPATASPRPSTRTSLREVSVVQPEGSSNLEIEILADGEMSYRTSKLTNPDRLVLDLDNTVNRIQQKQLAVNTPPLKTVRIAQFRNDPPVSRVVMDLDSQVPFYVRKQPGGLVVALGETATADAVSKNLEMTPVSSTASTAPAVAAEAPKPAARPNSVEQSMMSNQTAERGAPAEEPVLLASNGPSAIVAPSYSPSPAWKGEAPEAERIAPAVVLSEEPALAPAAAPVAAKVEAVPMTPVALTPAAENPAESPAAKEETVSEASPAEPLLMAQARPGALIPTQTMQQRAALGTATYTGEPISLNLKDVDLKDFFRLMHEVSGLNIVLDPNVAGILTIVLDEVPWDQAMDIVLKNNSLGKEVIGNVVRIARFSTLEAEEKQRLALAQAQENATPRETVTRSLSYATAAALVTPLKRFLSARGDIVPDPRTNTLIITDVPANIPQLDQLITTLDRRTPQVEIEARIVAATRQFARDIGTQLASSGASGNVVLGGAGVVGESPITRGVAPPLIFGDDEPGDPGEFAGVAQPLITQFGAVAPTSGLSLVLTGGNNFALDAIITAAESRGLGRLLSRPRIVTQNNVEGSVEQGLRIPIQTSVNNTITVQYVRVALVLTVTPQITSEGTVFLRAAIENTSINDGIPRILGIPALNTQGATTQVLVSDGGTVFIGGVIQTNNTLNEFQTPLLGSIPLIGHLFRRKSTSTTTQELLFFITPRITQS